MKFLSFLLISIFLCCSSSNKCRSNQTYKTFSIHADSLMNRYKTLETVSLIIGIFRNDSGHCEFKYHVSCDSLIRIILNLMYNNVDNEIDSFAERQNIDFILDKKSNCFAYVKRKYLRKGITYLDRKRTDDLMIKYCLNDIKSYPDISDSIAILLNTKYPKKNDSLIFNYYKSYYEK
jgi:hypothetical protein